MNPKRAGRARIILALVLATASAGCQAPAPTIPAAPENRPVVIADTSVQGRVVSVNTSLRYVVMDFLVRRPPDLDQRLHIYRESRRVGEVRVTGPFMGTTAAGDLVAGQAAVGDEVRED